ncbi:hypothetical protein [Sulfuricurvum sp.]|uniref:hypothetical protein n=1 Tax=Sulfuricurvum sp. TaxID=2025608 RepID=UPI00262FE476|nr:hypothetical protein [Sulfuricurvum sp.]MDD3596029.1 hypothetical protein [Sulfuricurvum sp.]
MIDKLIEIIKVRESCFILSPASNFLQKFDKTDKSVYILHDVYDMTKKDYDETLKILTEDEKKEIHLYILALSNHAHYAQKLSKCDKNITYEPLPESFLKLLRKIDSKIRKNK